MLNSIPLIFEGSYAPEYFFDSDIYSIGFGAYLTDTTTLVATFARRNSDVGDTDFYELSLKHLWHLSNGAIALEGNYGSLAALTRESL